MDRYSRHSELLSETEFVKIRNSAVMVAGAGGLGCNVLNLLARIGVGTIHFFEYSRIDAPDLNRQIFYHHEDLGKLKCETAGEYLQKINPEIEIIAHCEKIDENTQIPKVDLVFDCLDNFTTRYQLDNLLQKEKIPMIHAGVSTYFGQITTIIPGETKSLQKSIPVDTSQLDSKLDKRILPQVVTIVASLQVNEGSNYLCGKRDKLLTNKILSVDLFHYRFDIIELV
jgi:molybdopterin-synthase adenylyltransferase